jgi:alkylation response protein AidB-like acyl-CoA dehydrogenase
MMHMACWSRIAVVSFSLVVAEEVREASRVVVAKRKTFQAVEIVIVSHLQVLAVRIAEMMRYLLAGSVFL